MNTDDIKKDLEDLFSRMTGNVGNTLNFGSDYAREILLSYTMEIINKHLSKPRD
jgi:hypothetical protein